MHYWLLFHSLFTLAVADPSGTLVDGVAAVVNGHVILKSEVDQNALKVPKQLESEKDLQRKVLDQLINDYLVQQEVERMGLTANDAAIDAAIAQVMRQNGFSSVNDLKKALSKEGIGFEEYRMGIKKQIETFRLMNDAIRSRVQISDPDVKAELNRKNADKPQRTLIQMKMIFKKKGSKGSDKKSMKRLVREVQAGIPFEKIAARESEGPGKEDGGSIGAINPDDMQPELAKVIKTMKPGDLSDVIETKQGFYILYCVGTEKAEAEPMSDEAKKAVVDQLTNDEMARQFDSYIRGLRDKAQIEVLL